MPLSLLQRPLFEIRCQRNMALNGNSIFLYLGFPFDSVALDPPNGSQHSCMEQINALLLWPQTDKSDSTEVPYVLHSNGPNTADHVKFVTRSDAPVVLAVVSVEGPNGEACVHLQQRLCAFQREETEEVFRGPCSGLTPLQAKQCLLKAWSCMGDDCVLGRAFWTTVTEALANELKGRWASLRLSSETPIRKESSEIRRDHAVCLAAEHAERRRLPSTTEIGATEGAES